MMSEINRGNQPKQNNLDLEQLSTEALEELLRISQRSEDSDCDFIFRVLEVIERREQENPTGRLPDVDAAWTSFQNHYLSSVGDGEPLYADEAQTLPCQHNYSRHRIRHMILVAAVFTLLIGTLVAQAAGVDVFGTIARWTAETFQFDAQDSTGVETNSQPPLAENADAEFSSLQEAVEFYGITDMVVPTWWPDGFELMELKAISNKEKTVIHSLYSKENKSFTISIRQYTSANAISEAIIEKDSDNVVQYEKSGITHYIMSNIDDTRVSWTSGTLLCSISGDITEQDLEKMINSIYER